MMEKKILAKLRAAAKASNYIEMNDGTKKSNAVMTIDGTRYNCIRTERNGKASYRVMVLAVNVD